MISTRLERLKQLQAMEREELIGTIITLEAKQRNHETVMQRKDNMHKSILNTAQARVKIYQSMQKRTVQMYPIPESTAVEFKADKKALERTQQVEAEEAKQQESKSDTERFFKKKADKQSKTIIIQRPASRLTSRGT